jgi:hypothetical protein
MGKESVSPISSVTTQTTELRRIRVFPLENVGKPDEQSRLGLNEHAAAGVTPLLRWLRIRGYDVSLAQLDETKYDYCTDHEIIARPPLSDKHIGQLAAALVDGDIVKDWEPGRVNSRYDGVVVIDNVSTMPVDHIDTRAIIDSTLRRELYAADDTPARLSA